VSGVRIVRGGVERVPDLEPLTRSLWRHHVTVDPDIPGIPPRDEDGWWQIRSDRYREWLAEPDSFLLLAEDDEVPVGYALVTVHGIDDSHLTGDRFAELQSLAVLDDRRGDGIGTTLLRQVYREVRAAGIEEMAIGVMVSNGAAQRLYEREGFRPWLTINLGKVPDPDAR
jgi:ribosomal protein S18 acetylase RimI-like enzyme